MMNISLASSKGPSSSVRPSSSVHGIKRPREEEPPHSETNKKIKTATNDLFSTMPTEIITKILFHLDGISLVRFAETARKYKSLIDSDKYLSAKILFDKIYSSTSNFAKRMQNSTQRLTPNQLYVSSLGQWDAMSLLCDNFFFPTITVHTSIVCTLIRANHSKATEVFLKEMNKKISIYDTRGYALKARPRLFKALALTKHPRAEEFIPPINDYNNKHFFDDYAVCLVDSKLPKAHKLIHNILYSADNMRAIRSIYPRLSCSTLRKIGKALVKIKHPKASLLFQRVIDLAEGQSTFNEVDWLRMMAELKHPRTDEFLLRAINDAEKEGNYCFLAEQLFEINHSEAIKFAELAIRTSHSRKRLRTILRLVKVGIKSKYANASEFLELAIHLFEQEPVEKQWVYLDKLALIMVPVNLPKAIELFDRYRYQLGDRDRYQLDDENFVKHHALCKMYQALAKVNHQRTDEFFKSAIESANQMRGVKNKFIAFCKLAEAMAVKDPSEAFNMMQHTINILVNPFPTNFLQRIFQTLFAEPEQIPQMKHDFFVLKNIACTFAEILSQVGDQLHKMNEAKPKR